MQMSKHHNRQYCGKCGLTYIRDPVRILYIVFAIGLLTSHFSGGCEVVARLKGFISVVSMFIPFEVICIMFVCLFMKYDTNQPPIPRGAVSTSRYDIL